ncbi:hypothetical protein D8X55_01840 [Malacoplasma penetrans]|uniref:Uncharacterized protein n=1 Tax=Malacoplasma penetrans (strain HF-2) TaxID=272633 RepID=Q8EWR7_MALP2|nr:hypothetical protein [Malacoplasma penetrans]RXY97010.1 hypothetical protein D8X55_01840 [Malacoplasma penetrans]BAC43927.1 hypothetical protein [Malacoplasma penetrans HF-2]
MIKIKEMTDILLKDRQLYKECGDLFKYLAEVRINFSSLEAHNVPWQLSQVLEIISSNKLDHNEIDLEETIFNYCYNTAHYGQNAKRAVMCSFKSIFWITKIRNQESIGLKDIDKIIEIFKDTHKVASIKKNDLSGEDIDFLLSLINGKFSNNPLYFFPLFLLLIEEYLKNFPYNNSVISTLTNLYLIKNKLLFAPSICFSYPLLNNWRKYKKLLLITKENPKEISNFSIFVFDLLKQASVVSRAFISDYSSIKNGLSTLIDNKVISKKDFIRILKSIVFEEYEKSNKETETAKVLIKHKLVTKVGHLKPSTEKEVPKDIYMFNEYMSSLQKLINNKKEPTTKLFTLKENLN